MTSAYGVGAGCSHGHRPSMHSPRRAPPGPDGPRQRVARRWLVSGTLAVVLGLVLTVAPTSAPGGPDPTTHRRITLSTGAVPAGWRADAPIGTDLVRAKRSGDPPARFAISTRDAHGHWSSPDPLGTPDTGPDPGSIEAARLA